VTRRERHSPGSLWVGVELISVGIAVLVTLVLMTSLDGPSSGPPVISTEYVSGG
jgi:hypothetical protein